MDHSAIVMGASSGMGQEVARRLLNKGWAVGLAARRIDRLREMAEEYGPRAVCAQIDVNDDGSAKQLLHLFEQLSTVDLYIHTSGVGKVNCQLEEDIELQTVKTNALGFTRCIGVAYRWMAEHGGGKIVAISSIAGIRGLGPAPSYSATKALQHTYIQALEQQAHCRHLNIHFTEIRPGFVDTQLLNGSHYPMTMQVDGVVDEMMRAIRHRRHTCVIDWRYRLLVALWRLVPAWVWRRMRLSNYK
ncbi:MAG: SDR family NAD(P)-dependent oxidoreductase [Prevotellaceae bacterium]|jgi:NADP-dependent 3-hydroxy acid dehydrogenase YdfG|nr:SDR family NAD(P)-dependent oxidoreductase [Prevotellaceae bacterium]MDY3857077.1 SDR family NAD(P)-dependent oxidoreductase [Bacteroidaceae bacterium]